MDIKQRTIEMIEFFKYTTPKDISEEKWREACNKAIKSIDQLEESDKTKMNLKDLERANTLVENVKILETLSKSEIEYLNVKYPNGRCDSVFMKDELKEKIQKVFEDCAEESKAELKELGVEYD